MIAIIDNGAAYSMHAVHFVELRQDEVPLLAPLLASLTRRADEPWTLVGVGELAWYFTPPQPLEEFAKEQLEWVGLPRAKLEALPERWRAYPYEDEDP